MGNLFFSPSGRIGPSSYFKGMMILAAISAVINLLPLISISLAMIVSVLSLVLFIPFIFLGIKRSHDAGKSGWMVLVHILIAIVISIVLSMILGMFMGGAVDQAAINAAAESGDLSAVMDAAGGAAKAAAIPGAIAGLISTAATAFIVNMIFKQDPGDNQFGPVPAE